jgi:glycosyltransferase involved in cell wall biosynthesis
MDFSVSVIIPVYNAAGFVAQAVESALVQPEIAEVVLVEDGSPDNSLDICQALAAKYDKVHVCRHPDGANQGAGPSRNLGMMGTKCSFIAFLDADDFYLPGRFSIAKEIFNADPDCDAVFEAVGIQFENTEGEKRWLASDMAEVELTTLKKNVSPKELFRALIKGGSGHIHMNGLVLNRSILDISGCFSNEIADKLHEDTDFILRLAAVGRMLPGRLNEPVAIRRVHAGNRVSASRPAADVYRDHMRQRAATYRWCKANGLKEQGNLAFRRMAQECIQNKPLSPGLVSRLPEAVVKTVRLLAWPFEVPEVMVEGSYWVGLLRSIQEAIKDPQKKDYGI